jgi:hypothetical protein
MEMAILIAGLIVGGILGYILCEFRNLSKPRAMAYYRSAVEIGIMDVEEARIALGFPSRKQD